MQARYWRYRLRAGVRKLLGRATEDDFHWDLYNHHYRDELKETGGDHLLILGDEYAFRDGRLVKTAADAKPLHPNHRLLYETLLQLNPQSVCEFGCGGGDHLANLARLCPGLKLTGLDISDDQLALARERHPNLDAKLIRHDIAVALPKDVGQADAAYTQAVLMHIQSGDKHLEAFVNMFRAASRALVLMENWTRHPFMADIRGLHAAGRLPWPAVHFHYRDSEEYRRPHIMIVSSAPLPSYPRLDDYGLLTAPLVKGR